MGVGITVVTWTATDDCGLTATCTQNVTIFDNEIPVITDCPDDQTVNADPGVCGADVTVEAPVATDPCGVFSMINSYNSTSNASDYYPGRREMKSITYKKRRMVRETE